jgi:hypothetical protein
MLPPAHAPPPPRARRRARLALGVALSRRGALGVGALAIGALTTLGAVAAVFVMARRGERAPLERVPAVAASALAWGAGVLLAFAASVRVLQRDREAGITALLRARGAAVDGHLWARVGGLTLLLAAVVAGGTLATGLAATMLAARAGVALRALQGTAAAVVYALAFAGVLGPLAMAALGARSRVGGYAWLLMVLVLPELVAPMTSTMLPEGWHELTSIPGALVALRGALMPPGFDAWRAGRALVVLAIVVATCLAIVRRAAARVQREEAP